MPLESLLLSRDADVIRVFRHTLEKLSISVEVCRGAQSGSEILSSERFDAVVVDCDDLQDGLAVLETMRKSSSNKKAVAFAILNGTSTQRVFHLGANFVLQKPVSQVNAMRCLTAAINFMATERQRYFRHPVELPATLSFSKGNDLKATMTNLSDGGLTGISKFFFQLPGSAGAIECKGQIAWMDGAGRAGLSFTEMPKPQRQQLQDWLERQAQPEESCA